MSTNGLNVADESEMAECEGEKVVTMMDVLQEQQDFEDDANAVLGASDEQNCTFSKGYIKRQAIYACLTCCSDAKTDPEKRAGVCLACSLNCHENHELVELYTKRNFRCDCGNPKFNHPCQFTGDKIELNTENSYNQNFSGLYCICSRPYPDPEATFEDEMIQCIVCEDWLHASHLEATVPGNDQYSEMICKLCMEHNEFLHDYSELIVNVEDREVEVIDNNDATLTNGHDIEKLANGDVESIKNIPTDIEIQIEGEKKDNLETCMNENGSLIQNHEKMCDSIEDNENIGSTNVTESICAENNLQTIDTVETNTSSTQSAIEDSTISMETEQTETERHESNLSVDTATTVESVLNSEPMQETECNKNIAEDINEKNIGNTETDSTLDPNIVESSNPVESENTIREDDAKIDEVKVNDGVISEQMTDNFETENKEDLKETDTEKSSENTDTDINNKKDEDKQEPTRTEENLTPENATTEQDANKEIESDTLERATEELSKLASDDNESDQNSKTDTKVENLELEPLKDSKDNSNIEHSNDSTNQTTSSSDNTMTMDLQESTEKHDNKRKLEVTPEQPVKKPKLHECTRPKSKKLHKGATFWPANFRQKLCTCSECLTMYRNLSVMFLIDGEDTVTAYEALGKERIEGSTVSQYEKGLEALSSLGRVQQINALTEYNKMRDKLLDFLKSFKDRKEVVKEEDIRAFFAGMKPRREPDGVYFCR